MTRALRKRVKAKIKAKITRAAVRRRAATPAGVDRRALKAQRASLTVEVAKLTLLRDSLNAAVPRVRAACEDAFALYLAKIATDQLQHADDPARRHVIGMAERPLRDVVEDFATGLRDEVDGHLRGVLALGQRDGRWFAAAPRLQAIAHACTRLLDAIGDVANWHGAPATLAALVPAGALEGGATLLADDVGRDAYHTYQMTKAGHGTRGDQDQDQEDA